MTFTLSLTPVVHMAGRHCCRGYAGFCTVGGRKRKLVARSYLFCSTKLNIDLSSVDLHYPLWTQQKNSLALWNAIRFARSLPQ